MMRTIKSERRQRQIDMAKIHRKRVGCIYLCWANLAIAVCASITLLLTASSFPILIACTTLVTAILFLTYAQITWRTERDFINQERSILNKQLQMPQYEQYVPALESLQSRAA